MHNEIHYNYFERYIITDICRFKQNEKKNLSQPMM